MSKKGWAITNALEEKKNPKKPCGCFDDSFPCPHEAEHDRQVKALEDYDASKKASDMSSPPVGPRLSELFGGLDLSKIVAKNS